MAGGGIKEAANGGARIALEFGFSHPWGLEIELVEDRILGLRHDCSRPGRSARPVRHAEADHAAKAVGRMSAACQATGAPQSWPAMTACSAPSASINPTMSPTRWSSVYWSIA